MGVHYICACKEWYMLTKYIHALMYYMHVGQCVCVYVVYMHVCG